MDNKNKKDKKPNKNTPPKQETKSISISREQFLEEIENGDIEDVERIYKDNGQIILRIQMKKPKKSKKKINKKLN